MKKVRKVRFFLFSRIFLAISLIFCANIHAYYVGNGYDPNIIQEGFFTSAKSPIGFKFALIDDWIIGKELKRTNGRKFKKFQRSSTAGAFAFDFYHRVNAEVTFGSDSTNGTFYGLADEDLYFKTKNCLTYTLGGSAIVLEFKNFSLNGSGKYYRAYAKIGHLSNDGVEVDTLGKARFNTEEYQWGLQGAYTIGYLTPYLGWYYHRLNGKFTGLPSAFSSDPTIKVVNNYDNGIIIGCSISNHKYFSVNGEVRFIAETAISMEVAIKF